jgi:hypothetical protein
MARISASVRNGGSFDSSCKCTVRDRGLPSRSLVVTILSPLMQARASDGIWSSGFKVLIGVEQIPGSPKPRWLICASSCSGVVAGRDEIAGASFGFQDAADVGMAHQAGDGAADGLALLEAVDLGDRGARLLIGQQGGDKLAAAFTGGAECGLRMVSTIRRCKLVSDQLAMPADSASNRHRLPRL